MDTLQCRVVSVQRNHIRLTQKGYITNWAFLVENDFFLPRFQPPLSPLTTPFHFSFSLAFFHSEYFSQVLLAFYTETDRLQFNATNYLIKFAYFFCFTSFPCEFCFTFWTRTFREKLTHLLWLYSEREGEGEKRNFLLLNIFSRSFVAVRWVRKIAITWAECFCFTQYLSMRVLK